MNPKPTGPTSAGSSAKDVLNVPSILLIVTGAIGVLYQLYSLVSAFVGIGAGANKVAIDRAMSDPNVAAILGPLLKATTGPMQYVWILLGLALSGFIIFGALKMRNAQGYGLAMGSAIVAMVPCYWGCCCIGLPVGIWALALMMKPEIKSQFSA